MARRHRRGRAAALRHGNLTIRFEGPQSCGRTTALQAVRLLLEDAGFDVRVGVASGANHDGSENLLIVTPDTAALAYLREWIASEPV